MKNNTWLVVLVVLVLVGGAYMYRSQLKSMFMGYPAPTTQTESMSPAANAPVTATTGGDLVMTKTSPAKGDYLVGSNGMTLYIFDKDTAGVSNCSGGCAQLWPPYMAATAPAPTALPANVTTLARADGTMMYAYKGMPVYYYQPDKAVGDVTGDGVGGVWHLVKP